MNSVFEIHITVTPTSNPSAFRNACNDLGVKCIAIDLPFGDTKLQPMTGSFHRGSFLDVQRTANGLGDGLAKRGFDVVRTKIEQYGQLQSPVVNGYFEYHAKLGANVDTDAIRAAGGYLSSNAQNPSSRFLTFRAYGVDRPLADARFQLLLATIAKLQIPIRNKVREYCVYDSNPAIDHGWIS